MRSNEVVASAFAVLHLAGGPRKVPAAENSKLRRSGALGAAIGQRDHFSPSNLIAGRPAPYA
jgi:hypothetical protein